MRLLLGAQSGVIMPAMSATHCCISSRECSTLCSTRRERCYEPVSNIRAFIMRRAGLLRRTDTNGVLHQSILVLGFVSKDSILSRVDRETRLIAIMHGANLTGAVHNVTAITREVRAINDDVFVLSDGVQFAPHAPVDVSALGVDAYVFSPYKVFCVKGIGFGWLSDRMASLPHWSLAGKPSDDWSLGCPETGHSRPGRRPSITSSGWEVISRRHPIDVNESSRRCVLASCTLKPFCIVWSTDCGVWTTWN